VLKLPLTFISALLLNSEDVTNYTVLFCFVNTYLQKKYKKGRFHNNIWVLLIYNIITTLNTAVPVATLL